MFFMSKSLHFYGFFNFVIKTNCLYPNCIVIKAIPIINPIIPQTLIAETAFLLSCSQLYRQSAFRFPPVFNSITVMHKPCGHKSAGLKYYICFSLVSRTFIMCLTRSGLFVIIPSTPTSSIFSMLLGLSIVHGLTIIP